MSPQLASTFARTRGGRALLHGLCLARGRNLRWHLGGIVRELFHRTASAARRLPALAAAVLVGWNPSLVAATGPSAPVVPAGSPSIAPGASVGVGSSATGEVRVILLPVGPVDSEGVFLSQVAAVHGLDPALARIRLAAAPAFGRMLPLTRLQVQAAVEAARPELASSTWSWSGNDSVRVVRRSRTLAEGDVREMLASVLQAEVVKDRGELELRLGRPWTPVLVPDEPLTLKLLDMPSSGVSQHFIVRFELLAGSERLGPWQAVAQARVYRNILVAGPGIRRGLALDAAELSVERRDILSLREPLDESLRRAGPMEFTEAVAAGQPVLARSVRARPVVQRGMMVDGLLRDGGLNISMKVEVLADALPGQLVRVRNPKTKREFYAKVQDEQTVVINL